MKIDRIELHHVAMPLIAPWRTAYGEDAEVHSILCRIESGSLTGWGESSPLAAPCYSGEWAGGVFAVLRDWLAPHLVGQDIADAHQLQQRLAIFKGNPFAKAALDAAWWSLYSQHAGVPLHTALGAQRDLVPVGADFGVMDSVEELLAHVDAAVEQGFARVKLKFRPGWDLPMLRAVRERHPDLTLHIDCNAGYRLSDLPMFREIDELGLAMIEQPLAHDDFLEHAELQSHLRTPICLDETIAGLRQAEQAIALKSCRMINIKPGRVGGLTVAADIHHLCRASSIPCWVGGMLESAVGASHCIALAMLDNFTYPADIFPSNRFYAQDLADPPIELVIPPGGVPSVQALERLPSPIPELLERQSVQHAGIP
ncbi:MAG: o-succinylbenzoate synthase [Planctomycetes bacterium]|nr:o-succinylbenzoate synthase [Planctomycetota bacterium]